jgi:hypothetical protein
MAPFVDVPATSQTPWNGNQTRPPDDAKVDGTTVLNTFITIVNFYVPCIILSFGILGNILTVITMTRRIRESRNVVMSYHFRALALGDIAFLSLGDTQILILSRIPEAFKHYGDFFCKEYNYLLFIVFGVAVWNVATISIDRFVAVCFPLRAAIWCTLTKARAFYAFNIGFHTLFNLVKLWKYYEKDESNVHTDNCVNPESFPPWFEEFILWVYYIIVNYGTPLIVLILNVSILVNFRRQGKMLELDERGTNKKETQERNLTLMMMVVAFTFIVVMVFYPMEDIIWEYLIPGVASKYPRIRELSFYIAYYFTSLNSCLNFYIYFSISAQFRKDVIRVLHFERKGS